MSLRDNKKTELKSVLFLTNGFPLWGKHGAGGIGEYTYSIARELSNNGINVYVLGCSKDLAKKRTQEFVIDNIHAVVYPFINFARAAEYLNRLIFLFYVFKIVFIKKIQLIETSSYLGWLWPIRPWVPLVVRLHSSSTIDQFSKKGKLPRRVKFELHTIKMADHIVSVCEYVKNELLKHFSGLSGKNINVIYNGINTELFCPTDIPPTDSQVLFVGKLSAEKGVFDLLNAWQLVLENIHDAKLSLVGASSDGTKDEILNNYKSQLKDSINFIGIVPNEKLVSYYNQAAVVVIPSHYEANPLVLLEAMSCGCAVICPNHTGFPEIVRNNVNGVLYDTNDPARLSFEIIRLLKDKNLREKIGRNAREAILDNFSNEIILQKNLNLYRDVINS